MPKDKRTESERFIDDLVAEQALESETENEVVEEPKPVPAPKKKSKYTFGYVTSQTAFLRQEANEDSNIIAILKKDMVMLIDKEVSGFYYGTINNVVGYVLKDQIEIR